ncbi:hypothetical protein [Aliikangiella sp. IMCC44359]|uniref:hypothetical protein n=1 Tax=Aliikangiella sp. IMCC44359 TaxID=3459125 RepID=UPI00403AE76E
MESVENMTYDVRMKVEDDLLRYVITGERTFQAAYQLWERIYQDCDDYNCDKVHATVLLSGQISKMEIPLLVHRLIELNDFRPITCAWVDHNFKSYLDNLVGEKIPRPESMNIRIFNNDTEAVQWLKQQ